jgi:predicted metal-dependent phosphoesterase TrpH
LIDLHSHTNESDGSSSPEELIQQAAHIGLEALSITDHDTLSGYDKALPFAQRAGIELVRGIELSTKLHGRSVHLLGYFLHDREIPAFRAWVLEMQASRRERNVRLVQRLRELGMDITLEEAESRGRGMTGRPHFAQIMVEKGYVKGIRQAFDEYLDESAKGYVFRSEPQFDESVEHIRNSGGIASLAHPTRVPEDIPAVLPLLCEMGLNALEVYHSDHTKAETAMFLELAQRHHLTVTGGSDYHGTVKPDVSLGTGARNLAIPHSVLDELRRYSETIADASPACNREPGSQCGTRT